MADVDLNALASVIDLLRSKGVSIYRADGLELQLGPLPGAPHAVESASADRCKCGHPKWEHDSSSGLCLVGCDAETCVEAS